jgi:TolB-like protein
MERRLAAILAADVVGYGRMMEANETETLAALKERRRNLLNPLVARYHGRIIKVMGDGVLVEFASAVNAVQCAIDLQHGMASANGGLPPDRHIVLRIGVNLGDVIVEGADLYGDGVNIAARLEALAEPGGILIASTAYDHVKNKIKVGFRDLGAQMVKNLSEPIRAYSIEALPRVSAMPTAVGRGTRPSVAVLPFINMSTDPEQEYFADGLTEDLITDLSRTAGLFVIARHSSFAYKGKSVDVRSIAGDLGVRYVLEGSARRAAGRVRINVQLVDAIGGGHVWAERYDRSLDDIFKVQDEVAASIVEALVGRLTVAQVPERHRPANLEAYDLCVRGKALFAQSPQAGLEARVLFERAIALDPGYAEAYRWLAFNLWSGWANWGEPMEPNRSQARSIARKAVALDGNDASTRWVLGLLLVEEQRWSEAETEFATALKLDPNHADAWAMSSELMVLCGRRDDAIAHIEKALRLNPHPPDWYYWYLGTAQYLDRQYDRAIETLRRVETYRTLSRRTLAASLAQLGRLDEARQEAELFMVSNPGFTINHWAESHPFRDGAAQQHFIEGYHKAGLPD